MSTGQVGVGVHVFEMTLQDFPKTNITLTYADGTTESRAASDVTASPLCKVKLQFSMEGESVKHIKCAERQQIKLLFTVSNPPHSATRCYINRMWL